MFRGKMEMKNGNQLHIRHFLVNFKRALFFLIRSRNEEIQDFPHKCFTTKVGVHCPR
jgi:hypothetical protein